MVVDNYDKPMINLVNFNLLSSKHGLTMIKYLYPILIIFFLVGDSALAETDTTTELQRLKAQLNALTAQVNRLEQRLQAEKNTSNAGTSENNSADNSNDTSQVADLSQPRLRFSGDMRGRHEYSDNRQKPDRQRTRIRLRLAAEADLNDSTTLHMRFATGSDNPTSTNFTLGDAFTRKEFGLDRAYASHQFNEQQRLFLGKMKNPYKRVGGHGILFDSDLNPEGLAWQYSGSVFRSTLGGFYLDERSDDDNIMLYAAQLGIQHAFSDSALQLGVGYYDYDNLQGATPIYQNKQLGNRFNNNNQLINDFNIAELYAQYDLNHFPRPLSFFTAYLNNTAADDENEALMAGFSYGSAKKPGDWQIGYSYQYLEADAVYALFNDSSFAGGFTDSRGHVYEFVYGLSRQTSLKFAWIDAVNEMHLGTPRDYDRLTMDLNYWFK